MLESSVPGQVDKAHSLPNSRFRSEFTWRCHEISNHYHHFAPFFLNFIFGYVLTRTSSISSYIGRIFSGVSFALSLVPSLPAFICMKNLLSPSTE